MSSSSCPTRKNPVSQCELCDEFSGGARNAFAVRYGNRLGDRRLLAMRHFRIVPTLGQIVEGHLLVVPVEHYCALADIPGGWIEELELLCRYTRSVLAREYGNCVFFEHGMRGGSSGGCGIDHAHMHAVPVVADGVLDRLSHEFSGSVISSFAEIKESLEGTLSYLLFEDASATRHVFPVKNLPSQYMRRLVAESIGKSDWDWRTSGSEPELISAMRRLSPLFSPLAAVDR
jgi:diadenosine tetraphosphate (Ap4A) HIT family hydrolase